MAYRNKISITGDLGSGKSHVGKLLCDLLDMPIISTGAIQRSIASRLGMSTLELNKYSETHREIDDEIDGVLKKLEQSAETCIVDSRLAWFFVPSSLKVYLQVQPEVAAQRILNDTTRTSEQYSDIESAKKHLQERKESENMRYLHLYNADCANMTNYDLVIDTSDKKPGEVAEEIVLAFQKYLTGA